MFCPACGVPLGCLWVPIALLLDGTALRLALLKKKKKNGGFRSRWRRYLPGDTGRMKFPLKKKYLEPLFNSGKYRYREIRIPDFYPVMFLVMSGDGTFTP